MFSQGLEKSIWVALCYKGFNMCHAYASALTAFSISSNNDTLQK